MAVFLSPGVFTKETDVSLFAPAISSTIFGLVGVFSKGPVNKATFVSNMDDLVNTFGKPVSGHYSTLAGLQYLRKGRQLQVVRIGATANLIKSTITLVDQNAIPANRIRVDALTEGTWANGLKIVTSLGTAGGSTFKLIVQDANNNQLEVFDNLKVTPVTDADYFLTRVNGNSLNIALTDLNVALTDNIAFATSTLASGANGVTGLAASDFTGTAGTANGFKAFTNAEIININMLAAPDYTTLAAADFRTVITDMLSVCTSRGDAIAIIDPPFNATAAQVKDWHNGVAVTIGSLSFLAGNTYNSSYGALYWPWVKISNNFDSTQVFIPPSGFIASTYALNDAVAEPWFAPAGFNRGRLLEALDIERSPDQGERDLIYADGSSVNPIVNFSQEGITVWGQRTLQRTPTALDRVNVRRMLLVARKLIAIIARSFVFEPNDTRMWRAFTRLANDVLDGIKSGRGIVDFKVVMDSTTNTSAVIDRNEARAKLLIKPTKSAEVLVIDFVILSTGVRFEEIIGQ